MDSDCSTLPASTSDGSRTKIAVAIPEQPTTIPIPLADSTLTLEPALQSLPSFIQPPRTPMSLGDVAYLQTKGALTLPSPELQNSLVASFFKYIHPYMPILDIDRFLQSASSRLGVEGQVSLLLYQTILFAGATHVNVTELQKAGFGTPRQARKEFFCKCKLLYDFDWESDRLVLVQALLFMSLWYEAPEEHRNTWHWIDVAVSQAYALGLHHDPLHTVSALFPGEHGLRRRIWWSCFMRDRLVSFALKRRPKIGNSDFTVAMLKMTDFGPFDYSMGDGDTLKALCPYATCWETRKALAQLCVAQATLCHCLSYGLQPQVTMFEKTMDEEAAETFLSGVEEAQALSSCREALLDWYVALPSGCRYRPFAVTDGRGDRGCVVDLNRSVLPLVFYATMVGLYRAWLASLKRTRQSTLLEQEMTKLSMQDMATQIFELAGDLQKHGFERFLPPTGIAILTSAATVHLSEMRDPACTDRTKAYDIYAAADMARDAMERAFLDYPDQGRRFKHSAGPATTVVRSEAAFDASPLDELSGISIEGLGTCVDYLNVSEEDTCG
ncbi:hypothetical protein H9L39_19006 [Fusarium oxysporum f. sp. albedinis]|nr:hypothetical protein H9L39_19006 [Fusarium oxysporum f. sp. albedinis]